MPITDHLNRVLDLISVAVNKRLVVTMDEADEAQVLAAIAKSKSGGARGGGQEVEILEDGVVRVACLFRSDQWATNRLEIPFKAGFFLDVFTAFEDSGFAGNLRFFEILP